MKLDMNELNFVNENNSYCCKNLTNHIIDNGHMNHHSIHSYWSSSNRTLWSHVFFLSTNAYISSAPV